MGTYFQPVRTYFWCQILFLHKDDASMTKDRKVI